MLGAQKGTAAAPASAHVPKPVADTLRQRGWTQQQLADLDRVTGKTQQHFQQYYADHPKLVGNDNGTVANLWGTVTFDLSRGCKAHQNEEIIAVRGNLPPRSDLEVRRIGVGAGYEHHAVVVYPKGTDWQKTGVVVDPWIQQSADPGRFLRPFDQWQSRFGDRTFIRAPYLENDP